MEAIVLLKYLKKTDVEKRLTIPSKSLKSFPPLSGEHMVDFRVSDESGQVWKFRIYTRKKNKKYLKPVLTKGWREFVCRKKLGVGDRVAFYMEKEQAGAVNYRVQVEKAVKIFGAVYYQKPIHSDTNPVQNQETILSTTDQDRPRHSSKEVRVCDSVVFSEEKEQASAVNHGVEVGNEVKIFGAIFPHSPSPR